MFELCRGFSTSENKDVSSANIFTIVSRLAGKSLIKIKKSKGPRMDPCGTPANISFQTEACPFRITRCFLSVKKSRNSESKEPDIP